MQVTFLLVKVDKLFSILRIMRNASDSYALPAIWLLVSIYVALRPLNLRESSCHQQTDGNKHGKFLFHDDSLYTHSRAHRWKRTRIDRSKMCKPTEPFLMVHYIGVRRTYNHINTESFPCGWFPIDIERQRHSRFLIASLSARHHQIRALIFRPWKPCQPVIDMVFASTDRVINEGGVFFSS